MPIGKLEEGSMVTRPSLGVAKLEGQAVRSGQMVLGTKGVGEGMQGNPMRLGSDNNGQGETSEKCCQLPSNSSNSANSQMSFEEKFLSCQFQISARWHIFFVFAQFFHQAVQLHWGRCPFQDGAPIRWFSTSNGLLGAGPSGIMAAADSIIIEAGYMHVTGVPLVNPSIVVVWEVTPRPGNGFQSTTKIQIDSSDPPSLSPPSWTGYAPLAAYLFILQDYIIPEKKQGNKLTDQDINEVASLHCSPVSKFSAYASPETAAQSAATTTWGSGVTAVAFDPTRGSSVVSVVIIEGQYMSLYDPNEGPSITGWRVQCWESSLQPVLHPIFGNPASCFVGQPPMQTVWLTRVNKNIPPTDDFRKPHACAVNSSDSSVERANGLSFDPYDLPNDVRQLAQIVYSAHGGEVAFVWGGVNIFSGPSFDPVDNYHINVGSAILAPAFSSTSCCLASVWHDSNKD